MCIIKNNDLYYENYLHSNNLINKLRKQYIDKKITERELIKGILYIDYNVPLEEMKNNKEINVYYDKTYRYFIYNSAIDDEPDYIEDEEYIEEYSN